MTRPTIRGMFVMSHVHALKKARGPAAVLELERRFGQPIAYSALEAVPLRDEVAILEHALDLMTDGAVPADKRAFEAGKLHFTNFAQTSLGGLALLPDFKGLVMRASSIASQVFSDVTFASADTGATRVEVTMGNNDYPIDHFRGFFQAWLEYADLIGTVTAEDVGLRRYVYTISWH